MECITDYFEKNLALLKIHHVQAWQAVMDYSGEPVGELCAAEDGKPNLLVRTDSGEEVFLHHADAPESELSEYYALVPEDATGVALFVGMGLGYSAQAMIQSRGLLRYLVVVEPETGIFIRALHALDLSSLLSDRRVRLVIGADAKVLAVLEAMSRALQVEAMYILRQQPSFLLFPEKYQGIYDEVYKHGNIWNVSGHTKTVFGGKFVENRLRNMTAIHHNRLLEHLREAFAGIPAIIVAAGPSLDKNAHLLSQAKDKAVIIAADTALPALLAHGVTPDFLSCIDMEDITSEKVINNTAAAKDTNLICSSWVTPLVPKNFPARQVYWMFTAQDMERRLNAMLGGTMLTRGAGTVAQLNFLAAIMMGCSPVVFVGQDLAYTSPAGHTQHTVLTNREDVENKYARQEILWVEGYGGGKVPTDRGFLGFKHNFEEMMATCADRHFINATEGGVRLEGAEELPLHAVLDHFCEKDVGVAATIRTADSGVKMPGRTRMMNEFGRIQKNIGRVEREMISLEELIENASREIAILRGKGDFLRDFAMLPVALQNKFREIDALNASLDKNIVWGLLDETTMEGMQFSDRLNHEIEHIAGQPERYLEWLEKSIHRFKVINQYRHRVMGPFSRQFRFLCGHLRQEKFLLKKLSQGKGDVSGRVWDLLRLYYDSGDFVLLEKMLATHCSEPGDSAERAFYVGAIAANRCQYDEMEQNFATCLSLDSSWFERIHACREDLAGRFLGFARRYHSLDRRVAHRMLFKSARYATQHPEIRQMLVDEAARILIEITQSGVSEAGAAGAEIVSLWCGEFASNPGLVEILGHEQVAAMCLAQGHVLLAEGKYDAAVQALSGAVALVPTNPELYRLLAGASFAMGDNAAGVASLDQAVLLDRGYANYWESMGDNMLAAGQAADAVAAYERCHIALPEQVGLIKKIGDCYLAMGQLDAARAAFQLCKEKMMQQSGDPN